MVLLIGFGLGCLVPLFVVTLRDFRHLLVGQVFLLVIVTSAAFLIDPLIAPGWRWLTSDLQTALPGLFWLMCQLIFARRPRLLSVWGGMALYTFAAPALARPFVIEGVSPEVAVFFGWTLGEWFEYLVVGHGLAYVITHWRDDLVEARRRVRLGFLLVVGGLVGVATVSLNFGLYNEFTRGVITGLGAFIALICMTQSREGILELTVGDRPTEAPVTASQVPDEGRVDPQQRQDEQLLNKVMDGGFYRTEKLTLKKLSEATQIPEYRLRKVINQTLGYRNFNDYINQLRVADAAERLLRDPEVPVLNISLDVGYRTLSSFNRAFREIKNTTPTDYRQLHLEACEA